MDCEDHVACPIGDSGILVCHCIVQELPDALESLRGGVCFLSVKGTECREHGTVHGSGIVEEHSDDLLDEGFVLLVEWGGLVRFIDILLFGTIRACRVWVWLVLSLAGMCVLKSLSGILAVPWHGEMDLLVWVVPCDGEAKVAFPLPVMRCGVVHVECLK